jgi:hypothetical protein
MRPEQPVTVCIHHAGGEAVTLNCSFEYAERLMKAAQDRDEWLTLTHDTAILQFAPNSITLIKVVPA